MNQSAPLHSHAQQTTAALRTLPAPGAEAAAHSAKLVQLLRREMEESGGAITFARFMELALYAPGLGYYSSGSRKFGAQGDFVTAPEISPLFSRCVANQAQQVLEALGEGIVLEVGAGSGVMAAEILATLEQRESLPQRYLILELSADLRARQRELLERRVPHLLERVEWLESLPHAPLRGVVLANELLDAMPVRRFHVTRQGVEELCVACEGDGFGWRQCEIGNEPLGERLEQIAVELPTGYRSEVAVSAGQWLHTIGTLLERGLVLLIDYGFPRHEYYHPQRTDGTLMCHYRHRAHTDPLILPGLQDITAHVEFTAMAEAATAAGLELYGYTTQAYFLLATGLERELQRIPDDLQQRLELSRQVKTLTLPHEMGELFKVMAVGRGLGELPLAGFALRDLRGKL